MNRQNKKIQVYLKEKNRINIQNYTLKKELNKFIIKYSKYTCLVLIIVFYILVVNGNIKFNQSSNNIHIAMSLNDNYTYPIIVSITSIILNSNKSTFIQFHIFIGNDVKKENQKKISSLKRLNHKTKFSFHNIGNTFKGWIHGKKKITVAGFYRTFAAELIKNVDKIIYLDGDTLTYSDLSDMYQLNMNNLYFRGIREFLLPGYEEGIDQSRFICDGVMVMNLKLIREDHIFEAFKKYYLKFFNKKIYYGDQHIINTLFRDKIGFLPPKFGTWFMSNSFIKKYKSLKPINIHKKNS
jgi:lipopolysaccharide biosynthesis glycosyltransferase